MRWFILVCVVLLCSVGSASAVVQMWSNYEGGVLTTVTNHSNIATLKFQETELNLSWRVMNIKFWIIANDSVTFNGAIGRYVDDMALVNGTLKTVQVNVVAFQPGTYNVTWGFNASNTTNFDDSFTMVVTGNGSDVVGANLSDFGKQRVRYGTGGPDVVAQRLANFSLFRNGTKVVIGNTTHTNVTVVNVTKVVVVKPPAPNPVPVPVPVYSPPPLPAPVVRLVNVTNVMNVGNASVQQSRTEPVAIAASVAFILLIACGMIWVVMGRV